MKAGRVELEHRAGAAAARLCAGRVVVETAGRGFIDIGAAAAEFVAHTGFCEGLLTLFLRHTSASLTIQENADPDVHADLMDVLARLAPEHAGYRHEMEGPDDMPAHIKAMLTATSLSVPIAERRLVLGTWQGIYLIEHRARPHRREIALQAIGA